MKQVTEGKKGEVQFTKK